MRSLTTQILLISLLVLGLPTAGADETQIQAGKIQVKFDDLRELLESRSARLESARLEQQAASERQGSFARSFLPKIVLHASQENFKTGSEPSKTEPTYGAELNVNLFNGGIDQIDSDIRSYEFDKRTVRLQQVASEELQEARSVFWRIIHSQEKQAQIEAALKMNEQNLNAAARRIRSGVATESDRVEFEMKAVDLKRESSETKFNVESLKRDFAVLMNFPSPDKLSFSGQLDHNHDFEKLLTHQAIDHEFLYKDDEIQVQQSELQAKIQRHAWWPKIEAYAAHKKHNQRIEPLASGAENSRSEQVFGLRLQMEIGGFVGASREASALSKEASAVRRRADFKKRQTEAHMMTELAELRFLHDQVHDAEANILRAERYYKLTQSEYARGVKNSPDVLGASEKLFENRLKHLDIIKDFQIAKSHVLAKIGR